jgi:HAD superfamily hydrolase (TIGR01509 family)
MIELIILDFDGVIADSEILANAVLAEALTEEGAPTSVDDSLRLFTGKRAEDILILASERVGRELPRSFLQTYAARTLERFRRELKPVPGALEFIAATAGRKRCIASSSSPERLACSLEVLALTEAFAGSVFSAAGMARGKPHPDIFLHASAEMGADPRHAVIIEDSQSGVAAGVAAGATVIGLTAGAHIRPGHAEALIEAGAHHHAKDFSDVLNLLKSLDVSL